MDKQKYDCYVHILEEELVPAMGCTEPIALAYAAAVARKTLGALPETVKIEVSGNIIKNVKSVIVPNTDGLKGIPAAAAAGIVAGNPEKELEVIAQVTPGEIQEIKNYLEQTKITFSQIDSGRLFDIVVTVRQGEAMVRIAGYHTNIICIKKDGVVLLEKEYTEAPVSQQTDRSELSVEGIIEFANTVDINDIKEVIGRQIEYNTAIAEEGLRGNWGANIGTILLKSYGNSVFNRAKAMAAAGSDARMNGCELPVIINSGSGNQGMTTSLPVIVYAKELNVSEEMLYRGLVVSNLVKNRNRAFVCLLWCNQCRMWCRCRDYLPIRGRI